MAGPDRKRRVCGGSTRTSRADRSALNCVTHSSLGKAFGMAHVCRSTTTTPPGARTRTHSSRPTDRSLHSWMLLTLTTASCERSVRGSDSAAARSTLVRCSSRARRHRVRVRSTITADGSRPITLPFGARRAAATTPTPGPQPIITTLASGLGFTNSTAAISMSALPVAITVAMIRPPQPSQGSMRFKMSTTRWYVVHRRCRFDHGPNPHHALQRGPSLGAARLRRAGLTKVFRKCHPAIPGTSLRGAGGNRTPVRQAGTARDTTIPDFDATARHRRVD